MAAWTDNEMRVTGGAEELEIAPMRRHGTRRAPRRQSVERSYRARLSVASISEVSR
jgi:hypothetical protein